MKNKKKELIRRQVDKLGIPPKELVRKEIARYERKESYKKLALGVLTGLVAAVAVIIIITNLWLAVLQVDGSSMNPLLKMDDIVVAVRGGNPVRTDVIAFYNDNMLHIKRVIAVAGDKVDIDAAGKVSVNGKKLNEPYIAEPSLGSCDIELPFTVPAGAVFVMGDNRPSSKDSRSKQFGTVSRSQIVGIVKTKIWPVPRMGNVS